MLFSFIIKDFDGFSMEFCGLFVIIGKKAQRRREEKMKRQTEKQKEKDKRFFCAPCGIPMTIVCEEDIVTEISFGWENCVHDEKERRCFPAQEAERQLVQYFLGERRIFDFPFKMKGTEFQKKVWAELQKIPYGETRSYSEIAERIQNPKAVRAVGMANHRNPLAIVVPCHRVIGKNGSLTGYAGGIDKKRMLLELERKYREKGSALN